MTFQRARQVAIHPVFNLIVGALLAHLASYALPAATGLWNIYIGSVQAKQQTADQIASLQENVHELWVDVGAIMARLPQDKGGK